MLAGKNILRGRDAFHLHGQRSGAAGGHGIDRDAALPHAQGFGQSMPAIFVAVADQQDAARALRRKCADSELQRVFHIRGHALFWIDALRNADLVGLRGNFSQSGMPGEGDEAQLRA